MSSVCVIYIYVNDALSCFRLGVTRVVCVVCVAVLAYMCFCLCLYLSFVFCCVCVFVLHVQLAGCYVLCVLWFVHAC